MITIRIDTQQAVRVWSPVTKVDLTISDHFRTVSFWQTNQQGVSEKTTISLGAMDTVQVTE